MRLLTLSDAFIDRCEARALRLHPVSDEAFARAIGETSRIYTRSRADIPAFTTSRWALAARLRFFLPRDLPKIMGPLASLSRAGALPEKDEWRVLDLGAGLGASSFGAAAFAARTGAASRLDVVAVDRDPAALAEFSSLAGDASELGFVDVSVEARVDDLWSPNAHRGGPFDLIVLGLTLNEHDVADPEASADLLRELSQRLHPQGSIIVIEPALRTTTRNLQRVRDRLALSGPPFVFWPCPHDLPCPMLANERDWCHAELAFPLPPKISSLAAAAGLREERLTYSALVLRNEEGNELARRESSGRRLRFVSSPLISKGKVEAVGCDSGGELVRMMRLDRHSSPKNECLAEARRGDALLVERAEMKGTRLRVGEDTEVSRIDGIDHERTR